MTANKSYKEIDNLTPEAFQNPENFTTGYDTPESNQEQYAKVLEYSKNYDYFFVSANSTWGAQNFNHGMLTTSEGIGYHRSTNAILGAMLDSKKPVIIFRFYDESLHLSAGIINTSKLMQEYMKEYHNLNYSKTENGVEYYER